MLSNMHVEKHAKKWHEKVNTSYAYTKTLPHDTYYHRVGRLYM